MRVQIVSCILFCCCLLLAKTSSKWGNAGRTTQLLEVGLVEPSTSFNREKPDTAHLVPPVRAVCEACFEDMSSRPPINQVLKDMLMLKNQEFTFLTTVSFMLLVIY